MKLNNDVLLELYTLEQEVKEKQKRISEIKEACKSKGSFSTRDFLCQVKVVDREMIGPSDALVNTFGREALTRLGLTYRSKFVTVQTIPKAKIIDIEL